MPCIVCHRTSETIVWKENGYEGRLCRCGSVYTYPEPEPRAIDPRNDTHSDTFYSAYALTKAQWVRRIRPAGRLLEIGCGEGHFLTAAKSLGYVVAGIEPDPERARRVRQRLGIEVRCSLFEDLEWPRASFDVVYHCDLLSHFAEPVQALRKMSSLLSPGGILAFETGTLGGIDPFWYRWIGQVGFPQHRWLYCEESLRQLFIDAQLQVIDMRHFGLAPGVVFHRSYVGAARLVRRLHPKCASQRIDAFRAASTGSVVRRRAAAIYEWVSQFFRYRVGAVAPRIGPATWWIAVRPAMEVSC
jgi:SAM-dependent methyltransferase